MRSLFFSGLAILGNPKKYNPYIKVNMNIDVNIFRILNILAYFKKIGNYKYQIFVNWVVKYLLTVYNLSVGGIYCV